MIRWRRTGVIGYRGWRGWCDVTREWGRMSTSAVSERWQLCNRRASTRDLPVRIIILASCMYSESLRTSIYDPAATRPGVNRTIDTVAPKRIWNLLCTVNVKHSNVRKIFNPTAILCMIILNSSMHNSTSTQNVLKVNQTIKSIKFICKIFVKHTEVWLITNYFFLKWVAQILSN